MKNFLCAGSLLPIITAFLLGTSFAAPDLDLFNNLQTVEMSNPDTSPSSAKGTNFGDVDISNGSETRFYRIKNGGNQNLIIAGVQNTNTANFTVAQLPTPLQSIAPGDTRAFQITFHPSTLGQKYATIGLISSDPTDNPFYFNITANSVGFPEIVVEGRFSSSSSWENIGDGDDTPFSDDGTLWTDYVDAGDTESHTFRIRNTGGDTLNISLSSDNSPHFYYSGIPSSVAPGLSDPFTVTFAPQDLGDHTATISISNNDSNEGLFTFDVRGVAQAPDMVVHGGPTFIYTINAGDPSPRPQDGTSFGDQHIDSGAMSTDFRMRNTGDRPLDLTSATITGLNDDQFSITGVTSSLSPTATDVFTVSFNPSSAGYKQAIVRIENNDPNEDPYTFAIAGNGIGTPKIGLEGSPDGTNFKVISAGDITPSSIDGTDFGSTLGGAILAHTFRVTNSGTDVLTLSGSASASFNIFGLTTSLEPGESDEFEVRFLPVSAGTQDGTVTMSSNSGSHSVFTFDVTGIGLTPEIGVFGGDALTFSIQSSIHTPSINAGTDFGSIDLEGETKTNTFLIRNDGNTDLTIDSLSVSGGTSSSDFTLSNVILGKIAPQGTSTFDLTFNPSESGNRSATITIENDDVNESEYTFTVEGTGVTIPKIQVLGAQSGETPIAIMNGSDTPSPLDGTLLPETSFGEMMHSDFEIFNPGSGSLSYDVFSSDSQFEILYAGAVLSSGSTDDFFIRFTPTSSGVKTSTITVQSNAPEDGSYTFLVQGTTLAGEISVSGKGKNVGNGSAATTLNGTDFEEVVLSSTGITRTFRIENTGNDSLSLGSVSYSGDTADFSLAPLGVSSLPIGGETVLSLTFDPTAVGNKAVVVSIPTNDPDEDPFTFTVAGEGTKSIVGTPDLEISGNSLGIASGDTAPNLLDGTDFGSASQGGAAVSKSFVMKNGGSLVGAPFGTVVDVLSISASSDHPDVSFSSVATALRSSESDPFTIQFNPTAQGLQVATISVTSNDPNESPYTFTIQLQVDPPSTAPPSIIDCDFDLSGGSSFVEFGTQVGKIYELKTSTNLIDGSWSLVSGTTALIGTGQEEMLVFIIDLTAGAATDPKRFYRIEESEVPN